MTPAATVFALSGHVTWVVAVAVAVLILITWIVSLALTDASVIDVIWGPAFAVVAATSALAGHGASPRRWLLVALTALWGLRLGYHIARRKLLERSEDKRYAAMRKAHPDNFALWSLRSVFLLQGVLVLIVGLPLEVAADRPAPLGLTIVPGVLLWAIGLTFEAVGDAQLTRFKADAANRGQVMDRGLWRYTRHPNYFGDACVWFGLWLVVVPAGGTWWTVVSPVVMTVLLVRVSGAGLLERDIGKRRPGYDDYIKRTSGFVPLPPRGAKR